MAKSTGEAVTAGLSLEQQLQLLLDRDARRESEMAAMRAKLDELTDRPKREPETLIPEEYKAWAMLTAQEKTQLVATKLYGPAEGKREFNVQLMYRKEDSKGDKKPSEYPEVRLHASSEHEAKAYYQELCGITGFSQDHCELAAW